ncbi:MAG: cytochrome B [Saprospiraceae bacterium]
MYDLLKHVHSGLRWILLAVLIWAIYDSYEKWKRNYFYAKEHKAPFYAFILTHIQLLVGLIIYFITPRIAFSGTMMKDKIMRFYAVEHPTMMAVAIVLITIGYLMGKKSGSFKKIFWFYLIAFLIILASIPWPFMSYGSAWF